MYVGVILVRDLTDHNDISLNVLRTYMDIYMCIPTCAFMYVLVYICLDYVSMYIHMHVRRIVHLSDTRYIKNGHAVCRLACKPFKWGQ